MLPSLETGKVMGVPLRTAVLLLITGIVAWNLWLRSEMLFQHRTELGGVEHNVIHGIQKVMLGQTLYEDPEEVPFDVIQYTPAYYVFCAAIGKLLGLHGDDARAIFLLSRSVALFFNLLMGWYAYRCCRVAGAAAWSSMLAAGISFACLWEQSFSRMDAMVAAASAAALYHLLRWSVRQDHGSLIIASVIAVIGAFAKQSGVVMMALPVAYLALHKEWRALRVVFVTLTITAVAVFGATLMLGSPWAIYQNTVLGLHNGFSTMLYEDLFNPPTYKYFMGWHILAAIVVIKGFKGKARPMGIMALAIPMSLAFALISGAKYGSRLNYLHESLMFTFIGLAILLPSLVRPNRRHAIAWSFASYGILFAAYRTNSIMAWYRVGEADAAQEQVLRDDQAVRDVLVKELGLRSGDKVFITYREYLEHFLVGQSMLTQKDIIQFSRERLFDYRRFHASMRDGTIRFVITEGTSGPITILDSTYAGWEPVRIVNGRTILVNGTRR